MVINYPCNDDARDLNNLWSTVKISQGNGKLKWYLSNYIYMHLVFFYYLYTVH